jgi:hypothetical protein
VRLLLEPQRRLLLRHHHLRAPANQGPRRRIRATTQRERERETYGRPSLRRAEYATRSTGCGEEEGEFDQDRHTPNAERRRRSRGEAADGQRGWVGVSDARGAELVIESSVHGEEKKCARRGEARERGEEMREDEETPMRRARHEHEHEEHEAAWVLRGWARAVRQVGGSRSCWAHVSVRAESRPALLAPSCSWPEGEKVAHWPATASFSVSLRTRAGPQYLDDVASGSCGRSCSGASGISR